jgi:hypothetical protein
VRRAGTVTDPVAATARLLVGQAGGYLRNVICEPRITCMDCGIPVDDTPMCYPCRRDGGTGPIELLAPLIYAIGGTQSATLLRHYKDDVNAATRRAHTLVIGRLLYLALMLHQRCIEDTIGRAVDHRVVVPSLHHRPGIHPLAALAGDLRATDDRLALAAAPTARADRIVSGRQFVLTPEQDLSGRHILLIDDTWTTGSRARSAALTLRAAGAEDISVLVIGRWLAPEYDNNTHFIATRLTRDYDPAICPLTGEPCT